MTLRMVATAALSVFASAALATPTGGDEHAEAQAAHAAWVKVAAPELASRGDARSAFFAALLHDDAWKQGSPATPKTGFAQEQLARAATLGRDDRLVQWMLAEFCLPGRCDREDAVLRLIELDPDNAAVWHLALGTGSELEVEAILSRMAEAARYEIPFGEMTYTAYDLFASLDYSTHLPDVPEARKDAIPLAMAYGYVLAFAIPPYNVLAEPCDPKHVAFEMRRERCRKIGGLLADSGTLVSRHVGNLLLERTAIDDAQRDDAMKRSARTLWLSQASAELKPQYDAERPDESDAAIMAAELAALPAIRAGETEVARLERLMREHGVSLDPPAAWVAERAEQLR